MGRGDSAKSASDCIFERRTLKVLAEHETPWPVPDQPPPIEALIALAGAAPYHYPCDEFHQAASLSSPAPWRIYALHAAACRALLQFVKTLEEPLGKIGGMLAAADGLLLMTWLPDPPSDSSLLTNGHLFEPTKRNMEHIAAASAAVQNVLLGATERGIPNYWSSGGAVLRSTPVFDRLSIATTQILLAAVFLFPRDTRNAQTVPGANRGKCGDAECWSRWISADLS